MHNKKTLRFKYNWRKVLSNWAVNFKLKTEKKNEHRNHRQISFEQHANKHCSIKPKLSNDDVYEKLCGQATLKTLWPKRRSHHAYNILIFGDV
jgi:hypothetical protein